PPHPRPALHPLHVAATTHRRAPLAAARRATGHAPPTGSCSTGSHSTGSHSTGPSSTGPEPLRAQLLEHAHAHPRRQRAEGAHARRDPRLPPPPPPRPEAARRRPGAPQPPALVAPAAVLAQPLLEPLQAFAERAQARLHRLLDSARPLRSRARRPRPG